MNLIDYFSFYYLLEALASISYRGKEAGALVKRYPNSSFLTFTLPQG
jgi:hypothetical protein